MRQQALINNCVTAQDFAESANDIRLEGSLLTAELPMRDGGYRERQGIELNDRISNNDGQLVVSKAIPLFAKTSFGTRINLCISV